MNRWLCSLIARCIQVIAGKDSCVRSSRPPPTGGKTAAEGEVDLTIFILSPCSKWHYDNRAIIFSAVLHCLLSNNVGSFSRIVALVDEVADLLTVHHEVNAICSKDQEAVICMMQLNPFCFWLGYHTTAFKIQISYAPRHCKSTIHMRLSQTVPGNEATALPNPVRGHKRESEDELQIQTIPLSVAAVSDTIC